MRRVRVAAVTATVVAFYSAVWLFVPPVYSVVPPKPVCDLVVERNQERLTFGFYGEHVRHTERVSTCYQEVK